MAKTKGFKLGLFCLTTLGIFAFGCLAEPISVSVAYAEEEPAADPAPVETEVVANTVLVEAVDHAKITTDIVEGEVGDICTVNVKTDLFYIVESITVNGTALIESETTYGEYSFALVAGENRISTKIILDEKAVGVFYDSMKAIENKDWTTLFSVRNIVAIVTWLLNGTCLIAIVRYFVKDKKLAAKVEKATKEAVEKVVPEQTKETVLTAVENVITPIFTQLSADSEQMKNAMNVFAKCLALAQEDSPEARRAVIDELSNLNLGTGKEFYDKITAYIDNIFKQHEKAYADAMAALKDISNKSQEIIGEDKKEENLEEGKVEEIAEEKDTGDVFDGTQI